MDFLQLDLALGEGAEHHAPGLDPDIAGEIMMGTHLGRLTIHNVKKGPEMSRAKIPISPLTIQNDSLSY
jgi:hypothetical protein